MDATSQLADQLFLAGHVVAEDDSKQQLNAWQACATPQEDREKNEESGTV
jgi:hypothetical protein